MRNLILIISVLFSVFAQAQSILVLASQAQKANEGGSVTNYYTNPDAANETEVDAVVNWVFNGAPSTQVTSVANTDSQGGSFALRFETLTDDTYPRSRLAISGFTIGNDYIVKARGRRLSGNGNISDFGNVSNEVVNMPFSGTAWVEGTITFTADDTEILLHVYTSYDPGSIGYILEFSSFIINDN